MEKRRHTIDIAFIIILIGTFLLLSIALTILGGNVYKKTVASNQEAYQIRTASLYFDEKLHQNDAADTITLDRLESGQQALILTAGDYQTWIFLSNGTLREATVKRGTAVTEGFGQSVLSLSKLDFTPLKANLLRITAIAPDGARSQVDILIRASDLGVEK